MDRSTTHPVEVVRSYEQLLKESTAEGRYIEINGGHKQHSPPPGTLQRRHAYDLNVVAIRITRGMDNVET